MEPDIVVYPLGCNASWCAKYRSTEKGKAAIARANQVRRERRAAARLAKQAHEQKR